MVDQSIKRWCTVSRIANVGLVESGVRCVLVEIARYVYESEILIDESAVAGRSLHVSRSGATERSN